jgi:hypothetical protein
VFGTALCSKDPRNLQAVGMLDVPRHQLNRVVLPAERSMPFGEFFCHFGLNHKARRRPRKDRSSAANKTTKTALDTESDASSTHGFPEFQSPAPPTITGGKKNRETYPSPNGEHW